VTERFLAYLEFEKRYSSHTVLAYRTDLVQFGTFLKDTYEISNSSEADYLMIRSWLVTLSEKGTGNRSISRKISVLRAYFRFLQREDPEAGNPMDKIIPPKIPKRLPEFVEERKMKTLLDEIDFGEGFTGIMHRTILELFYVTGVRLSELTSLTHDRIDLTNNTLRVTGKRNKERIIPFSQTTGKMLRNYIQEKTKVCGESGYFFQLPGGNPLYPKKVYLLVRKYLGMVTTRSKRSPHVLRHTFATHLLNNGADLTSVKELLGHSSLAATQVYTHNTIEKLKNVYNQAHPKA
jgi:integrase/recombinase XerC